MKRIEVDDETDEALRELKEIAARRRLTLAQYLRGVARQQQEQESGVEEHSGAHANETAEQWIGRFRRWADAFPKSAAVADDSRETIYPDRV